jgi:hypothetical protein
MPIFYSKKIDGCIVIRRLFKKRGGFRYMYRWLLVVSPPRLLRVVLQSTEGIPYITDFSVPT